MITRESVLTSRYETRPLGELVHFLDSQRRPVTAKDRAAGPYPYFGANGQQGTIADYLFDEPLVLLAEDGGHFDEPDRGIAYRVGGKTWVNNHAHVLRAMSQVDLGFLTRALESYDVRPFVTGTTRGKLTKAGASRIEIPVPPLDEQRRIAAILDQADALRAKRREALGHLDDLTQSIFLDMFGDPVANDRRWDVVRFADLLARPLRNGVSPSKRGTVMARVLTLSAVTGKAFRSDAHKEGTFERQPPPGQCVRASDLLICRGNGNIKLVGRGFFPAQDMPKVAFPDTIIAAEVDLARVSSGFLEHLWNSAAVRRQIESFARTTNGTFKVNQTMLENVTLPSPPQVLQKEFSERANEMMLLKEAHRAQIVLMNSLFASLQSRAFAGEL